MYTYRLIALDPKTGEQIRSTTGVFYGKDDATLSTPLTVLDANGASTTLIATDPNGVLTFFSEDQIRGVWKAASSPALPVTALDAADQAAADAADARDAAQAAAAVIDTGLTNYGTQVEAVGDRVDSVTTAAASTDARLNAITTPAGHVVPPLGSGVGLYSPDGSLWVASISNTGTVSWAKSLTGGGPTVPPPADNANLVTIGTATHVLDGTNVARDENKLIRYTYSTTQTSTPTNEYGVEVTVSLATNKVTAVNNRLATGGGPTTIPSGSYVLSGHGLGAGYAGQWLLDNATVNATVALSTDTPPPPPPTQTDTTLPPKIVSMWHHAWQGPQPWTGYPSAARAQINMIVLGLAQSGQSGTGKLSYYNRFGSGLASSIAAAKAAGCSVQMGFGGSSDGGITITNNTQADQAFDSIQGFVSSYGITGVDVDLEPSGSSWTESALVYLCTKLKQTYGPKFIIGLTPGLYGEYTARWMSAARALGSNYDYMAPMLYDFPEAGDSRIIDVCLQKCDDMVAGGVPQSKMILGLGLGYSAGTPTFALARDAWAACEARYPGIRGCFQWEDWIDSNNGWTFATQLGPVIRS